MLGAAMAVFNQAVLLLAMLFTVFTTIKGTVDSAHDGVILGKKMSEIWVPIRTVAGTAFLLPLSSGFSLIQMGVLWLALQGVGIADTLWTAALERFAETGTLVQPSIPAARPLAASMVSALRVSIPDACTLARAGGCELPTPLRQTPWRGVRRFCCGHG